MLIVSILHFFPVKVDCGVVAENKLGDMRIAQEQLSKSRTIPVEDRVLHDGLGKHVVVRCSQFCSTGQRLKAVQKCTTYQFFVVQFDEVSS